MEVDIPIGLSTFPELMPAIHAMAEVIFARAYADLARSGHPLACEHGCALCCHHLVMVGEAEAFWLAELVAAMDEPLRSAVRERFRVGLERLELSGLLPDLVRVFTLRTPLAETIAPLLVSYWRLRLPCPFLENGSCLIYAQRPLVCRQHAVTSPVAGCATPFAPDVVLEKVLVPVDLAGAAAAFDGSQATQSRALPLLLCLLREHALRRRVYPRLPALDMLARYFDFALMCYARQA